MALISGSSSVGRAIAFQAISREFEPRLPLNVISNDITFANVAQLVEHHLAKVRVVSSNLIIRSARLPSERSKWRRSKEAVMNNSGFGYGPLVYRSGRQVFILVSGVRFPGGLQ